MDWVEGWLQRIRAEEELGFMVWLFVVLGSHLGFFGKHVYTLT